MFLGKNYQINKNTFPQHRFREFLKKIFVIQCFTRKSWVNGSVKNVFVRRLRGLIFGRLSTDIQWKTYFLECLLWYENMFWRHLHVFASHETFLLGLLSFEFLINLNIFENFCIEVLGRVLSSNNCAKNVHQLNSIEESRRKVDFVINNTNVSLIECAIFMSNENHHRCEFIVSAWMRFNQIQRKLLELLSLTI